MKKRFIGIVSLITALMIMVGTAGCNLVTKDNERDVNQVVATVQIDDGVEADTIYKKDMIIAYLNYGYMYVQYYGYTQAKTFTLILDNLIQNRLIVQTMKKDGAVLTEEQETEAKYNAYKSINDLLKSYEEKDEESKGDSLIEEVRAVPTNATNAENEIDKAAYVTEVETNKFDVHSTEKRRSAFNKVVKLLKDNGLLGDEFKNSDLMTTTYFKQTLNNFMDDELLKAYEKKIQDEARKITWDKLEEEFGKLYDKQKAWNNAEFTEALSTASIASPMLYSGFGGYGYVYNLLLGVSDAQKEDIEQIKKDNPNISDKDYATARKDILAETVVKDLRSSWILSGYDFDFDSKKFTGDYAVAGEDGYPFQGEIEKLKDATDAESAEYRIKSVTPYNLDDFISAMETYIYGEEKSDAGFTSSDKSLEESVYKFVDNNETVAKYSEKINELLFAFSTDVGSLNTYKGYSIAPQVDGAKSEQYVKTFGDAGRFLFENGKKSSYIIVASDYGYHVMFYSEVLKANEKQTLKAYLGLEDENKALEDLLSDWENADTTGFLYNLINTLTSSKVSHELTRAETNLVNLYRYGEKKGAVKLYEKAYADLLN